MKPISNSTKLLLLLTVAIGAVAIQKWLSKPAADPSLKWASIIMLGGQVLNAAAVVGWPDSQTMRRWGTFALLIFTLPAALFLLLH